jgi:NAD(P)H-flavin reductase/hemoglobin-like flavoprotein
MFRGGKDVDADSRHAVADTAPVDTSWATSLAPPVGGGLVVGQAERRLPPVELPAFYEPQPVPPPVGRSVPTPITTPPVVAPRNHNPQKVREAWELVSARSDQLVATFYAELFLRLDEAVLMFPSSMTKQRQDFGRALVQWVATDDPEAMTSHLAQLGADHRKFDVEPRHYEVAGAALVSAWKTLAGSAFTAEHEAAVVGSYTRLASIMIDGAIRHMHEPSTWGAQVVDHQRVLGDFAVIRIQPDAPYPYKPGQYLTLELPAHRRQWRQMSIASAPRGDNTFDIHVRAIGGSGVSAALVMHTKPGDRLRLGPPRGNDLVVEPGTVPGGLLCVASGTGAAPITAVIESILAWPNPPSQLYAFVGGRTRDDVYPVNKLYQLIQADGNWRRAQVHGVVSDDPGYEGFRGQVEYLVPTLKDWAQLGVEVLVAGPNPMIAATVTNLVGVGVPLGKIHFDQYDAAV